MPDNREPDREVPLADATKPADVGTPDPNDVIPVPPAMSAAEIDKRAEVVEALRGNAPPPPSISGDADAPADA